MIYLSICDDDTHECSLIENIVRECLINRQIPVQVSSFSDGKNLLYEIEDHVAFDLFLLDIEMPGMNGIWLAKKVKSILPNALLIFVTSYEKYVYESFKIQPFRFIPKRCIEQMLPEALLDAVSLLAMRANKFYPVENRQGMEKIPIQDITHIRHEGKYACIERQNGQLTKVRKTLKQVYAELPEGDFVWADRGCVCNISHISKLEGMELVLTSGVRIAVSRDRLADIKDSLRAFWIKDRFD